MAKKGSDGTKSSATGIHCGDAAAADEAASAAAAPMAAANASAFSRRIARSVSGAARPASTGPIKRQLAASAALRILASVGRASGSRAASGLPTSTVRKRSSGWWRMRIWCVSAIHASVSSTRARSPTSSEKPIRW